MNLTLKIVKLFKPTVSSNKIIYKGSIRIVFPINLTMGATVLTTDGIGTIVSLIPNWVSKTPEFAEVQLYRGYVRRYSIFDLNQYIVYHRPMNQFILLSPADYRYILKDKQDIEYRVTLRKYARLTDDSKEDYSYIKTLSKTRYGIQALRLITRTNLIIKKD